MHDHGTKPGARVFLVGIDGATLDLIEPWVAQGELPNIARFISDGMSGTLHSTLPPMSPPAWASFQTGMNPGKHSIFEFYERDVTTARTPVSARSFKAQPFWEIIGLAGKKVGVMNVLGTYPVRPVNGFLIAGMLSPRQGILSYPDDLIAELKSEFGGYVVDDAAGGETLRKTSPEQFVDSMMHMTELRAQAALHLAKTRPWDLFLVVFVSTDRIQHYFWKYIDPERLDVTAAERQKYGQVILDFYRYLDSFLGEVDSLVGDDVVQLVVSDHGFGPVYSDVNMARWLAEHGYLRPSGRNVRTTFESLKISVRRALPTQVKNLIWSTYVRKGGPRLSWYNRLPYDWEGTRAYPFGSYGGLCINLRGREPSGIVEPEAYESLREEIAAELPKWKNPQTGRPVVRTVYRREEIYSGPYVDQAPDLCIEWEDYAYVSYHTKDPRKPLFCLPWRDEDFGAFEYCSNHRPEGIVLARGKGIKNGVKAQGAEIFDIAPTILHIMGLPVPAKMDGRVLEEMFDPADRAFSRPVTFAEETGDDLETGDDDVYSDEERKQIEDHLANLGYL